MASDSRRRPGAVLVGPALDDRARLGVAGQLQVGEGEMVGAPVDAFDDDIGGPLELVVQSARDQPTEHRLGRLIPV